MSAILTSPNPTVQEVAASLVRVFEGERLAAYQDTGGKWTIGFGHTGPVDGQPITKQTTITHQQAVEFIAEDFAPLMRMVAGEPLLRAAALVSFGYNCGIGALERILAGGAHPEDFVHDSHGNVLPGLVSRRNLEGLLMEIGK